MRFYCGCYALWLQKGIFSPGFAGQAEDPATQWGWKDLASSSSRVMNLSFCSSELWVQARGKWVGITLRSGTDVSYQAWGPFLHKTASLLRLTLIDCLARIGIQTLENVSCFNSGLLCNSLMVR